MSWSDLNELRRDCFRFRLFHFHLCIALLQLDLDFLPIF